MNKIILALASIGLVSCLSGCSAPVALGDGQYMHSYTGGVFHSGSACVANATEEAMQFCQDKYGVIICQNNFRHSFSLTWSGKTCDIRRSL